MGPTIADCQSAATLGAQKWIEAQFNAPLDPAWHYKAFDRRWAQETGTIESYAPTFVYTTDRSDPLFVRRVVQNDGAEHWAIDPSGGLDTTLRNLWERAYTAPDQLRQRVVHALSQFLVVSGRDSVLYGTSTLMAGYVDMLNRHAFGNYKDLIADVARSPAMGRYLSHLGNLPPSFDAAGKVTRVPDQNFARELLQLFTLGLTLIGMDGEEIKDASGQALPSTSTQRTDIVVLSNVFTGWTYDYANSISYPNAQGSFSLLKTYNYFFNETSDTTTATGKCIKVSYDGKGFYEERPVTDASGKVIGGKKFVTFFQGGEANRRSPRLVAPMRGYTNFVAEVEGYFASAGPSQPTVVEYDRSVSIVHSTKTDVEKQLNGGPITFLGKPFEMGNNPEASLQNALTRIFEHQNLAPFVAKQMIQHMVTSNPSPAYVKRVATRFKDSQWKMTELILGILLDPEARSQTNAKVTTFGRLREPYLRVMALCRAFGVADQRCELGATNGIGADRQAHNLNNGPMMAPSVFNDFSPRYTYAGGQMAAAGKVAPQLQIATESAVIAYANAVYDAIENGVGQSSGIGTLSLSGIANANPSASAMVEVINNRLFGGAMSTNLKTLVLKAATGDAAVMTASGIKASDATYNTRRFKAALFVAAVSTEFMVQK
jgi:uncharacterized protein (DUF1800 family)